MPQIEKRFNFSSFDVGMIAAANDVPAVIFGLIICHYGNFGNKVKWIGLGGIVTGEIYPFMIFTVFVRLHGFVLYGLAHVNIHVCVLDRVCIRVCVRVHLARPKMRLHKLAS